MAEIEHSITGDLESSVEISEEYGYGFYIEMIGCGSSIRCYMDNEHLQSIYEQLVDMGYESEEDKTVQCD